MQFSWIFEIMREKEREKIVKVNNIKIRKCHVKILICNIIKIA